MCVFARIAEAKKNKNPIFITQTEQFTTHIYINNILYIVITRTCFDASASSYPSTLLQLQKSLRLQT